MVIHVDADGLAPDLPIGDEGGPCMLIRLQPMSGGFCRFSFVTVAEGDTEERIVLDVSEVLERIATTGTYPGKVNGLRAVQRYGVFRFQTSTISAPTSPVSTAHRLRPSMMNLDTISRNLFGTGSVSSRSQAAAVSNIDMFGTSSTRKTKSVLSRTSTMETTSRLSIEECTTSSQEGSKRLSRQSSSPSEPEMRDELIVGAPYETAGSRGMEQSEVDLNERLNLARKNSKSMAALVPKPSGARRLGSRSVAELRSQVEERRMKAEEGESILLEAGKVPEKPNVSNLQFDRKFLRLCRRQHPYVFAIRQCLPRSLFLGPILRR